MKYVLVLASLIVSTSVFAGTGDFGSVGGPSPSSVTSTSEQLQMSSHPVTIFDLCQMLAPNNKNVEWGPQGPQVRCFFTSNGLIEIRAKNNDGALSIYANPTDTVVTQFYELDDYYKYSNNLGQSLYVALKSVNEETASSECTYYLRPDVVLRSDSSRIQVGYYFQEFLR